MTKNKEKDSADKFFMEVIVCPTCKKANEMDLYKKSLRDIRPVGDLLSGVIYGYFMKCEYCESIEFIGVINEHFKMFDLSKKREGLLTYDPFE